MALIIGNWKMHGSAASLVEVGQMIDGAEAAAKDGMQLVVCPPATMLREVSAACRDTKVQTGGQDCHHEPSGAHTGCIAAEMLAEAGASYCIIGHSEARARSGDSNERLGAKVDAVLRVGMVPIFCVGESLEERQDLRAIDVVTGQLDVVAGKADQVIVAYEPIWAIGTGLTPKDADIAEMHLAMREKLGPQPPLLYGGSVKPGNAAEILRIDNVGGALVGGASLVAKDFLAIARAI
ncbi:MAG: triose-phosphate isomerase [Pseudomonadota bacterium]